MPIETTYRAKSLEAIAADFDKRAAYAREQALFEQSTKIKQAECRGQAEAWEIAASILRRTTIEA